MPAVSRELIGSLVLYIIICELNRKPGTMHNYIIMCVTYIGSLSSVCIKIVLCMQICRKWKPYVTSLYVTL